MGINARKAGEDLTTGPILSQLTGFVLPLLLANLIQQLYNSVDTMVIGLAVGSIGTAGVSNGGEAMALLSFLAVSFGSAGQIYVAQLSGAGDRKSIGETAGTLLSLMVLMSLAFTVLCIGFSELFLLWINTPPEAFSEARGYMILASLGLPFVFGYNALSGILRGLGESRRPLVFISIAALLNIVLDLLLVLVVPLASAGTAIATSLAEAASFFAALAFCLRHRGELGIELSLKAFLPRRRHMKVLLSLGLPLSAQSAFIHLTQLLCTAEINTFGLAASAANSIGNKLQRLITVFITSLSTGSGAMIGQNLGARKLERVPRIVHSTLRCSLLMGFCGALVCLFLPRQAFGLFTKDSQVIELGVTYMRVLLPLMAFSPVQGSYMAVLTGAGKARLSFIAGLLDGVVLRLGLSFLLAYGFHMGVTGFFLGNVLARIGPIAVSVTYYRSGKWRTCRRLGT